MTQLFRISAAGVGQNGERRRRAVQSGLTIMGQSSDLSALFAQSSSDPLLVALYEQQRLQASQLDDLLALASESDSRRT